MALTFQDIFYNKINRKIILFCNQKEYSILKLVEKIGVRHHNLVPHLKLLEKEGFINRNEDKYKGRKTIIELTDRGKLIAKYLIKLDKVIARRYLKQIVSIEKKVKKAKAVIKEIKEETK